MKRNLYRDEVNHIDEPTAIEKDLSRFENEASKILNPRFLSERKIIVTSAEYEKLMLFFAVMSLRANSSFKQFQSPSKQSRKSYAHWQRDNNNVDLWKRNLGYIINCRTLKEVLEHRDIDQPFKIFMLRDIFGITGKYISVIEPEDSGLEFIIGDTYPVVVTGEPGLNASIQFPLHMYSVFPIAPSRLILIASNGVEGAPRNARMLHDAVFDKPSKLPDDQMSIRVKRAYKEEVQYLNGIISKEATEGFVFQRNIQSCFAHFGQTL